MNCTTANLLLLLFIAFALNLEVDSHKEIKEISKKHLLHRGKDFLRYQPLRKNLRNYIKRHRRKALLARLRKLRERHRRDADLTTNTTQITTSSITSNGTSSVTTTSPIVTASEAFTISGLTSSSLSTNSTLTTLSSDSASCTNPDDIASEDDYEMEGVEESTTQKKELLGKVMKDVQELIRFENAAKTSEGDASLCNITGDWDSFAGGMQIRFFNKFRPKNPVVKIVPQDPPMKGFLTESQWNATSLVPFKRSSLVAVTAISTKGRKIANFLGECRICEGSESITGHWMIRRRSKNCKDREEANTFISDVLRKNNMRKLKKEQKNQGGTTTTDTDLSV